MPLLHVVPMKLSASDIAGKADGDTEIATLNEDKAAMLIEPDQDHDNALIVNSKGTIIETDIQAGNDVIHVIDLPLLP